MKESRKVIDARGQACPAPVILTKKAIEEGGFDVLEVLVDNEAARKNVRRFAGYSNHAVIGSIGTAPLITITLAGQAQTQTQVTTPAAQSNPVSTAESAPTQESASGLTVLLASDRLGNGDDALGALLMRGFVYALAECEARPARVIMMNGGVRLAVDGSDSLDNLKRLAASGVEILACGTCLEFLGLKDALAVGRVTNMYEIAGHLTSGRALRV